jgi:hypothetical protein
MKKVSRNALCPCGSGKKYKYCCDKPVSPKNNNSLMDAFVELPSKISIYYLDTCVWGTIARSKELKTNFSTCFRSNDYIAALSYFTLFELSRAPKTFISHDPLFYEMRHSVWIPCLHDQVIESELKSYPKPWKMRWLPVSTLVDEDNPDLLNRLASNSLFIDSRDRHLKFGLDHFMDLEQLKENFPPENGEEYTPDDARFFAWCNVVDYLGRHFRDFLGSFENNASNFKADRLLSLHIRSLFLFYKYYIHGQSPGTSDFLDFAHVSYAPYCNVFVTERNACNVLRRIKSSGVMLTNTRILHISDFSKEFTGAAA